MSLLLQAITQRLYVRLWLAVILAIAFITASVIFVLSQFTDAPLREVLIRNPQGEVIGDGIARPRKPSDRQRVLTRSPGLMEVTNELDVSLPLGQFGPGPEFVVKLSDGQVLHMYSPRTQATFLGLTIHDLAWLLAAMAVAVALGTYPVVRRLTRRLERLQQGVEQWSEGNLSSRLPTDGQDEVASLAQQFNRAADQIEALFQSQRALLANASHELRTPLTRIRMGLELMGQTPTPEHTDEVKRNIAELDELIGNILLSSRLDSVKDETDTYEQIDLTGLASEECVHADVELDLGLLPKSHWVMGEPKLLRQLLRNLLQNAHKHANGAGLEVALWEPDEYWVCLRVSDAGPGIPEAYLERIFEPFFRLPEAAEKEGAGLGLALVRSIVQRLGGSVRASNQITGGAVFQVWLPKTQAADVM